MKFDCAHKTQKHAICKLLYGDELVFVSSVQHQSKVWVSVFDWCCVIHVSFVFNVSLGASHTHRHG